ncbi:ABC transporter ATP-binding protein [Parathalassolituus penaei]
MQQESRTDLALELRDIHKEVVMAAGSSDQQVLGILQGIHLRIKQGSSVAIVGASGSGKSTLLGIMAGLDLPSSGQLSLLGQRLDLLDEDERALVRADGVSFVFQNFQLLPGLTALENVMLPLEIRPGAYAAAARQEAKRLLERVGLGHRMEHYPSQLSGGEQQRVALARAFAGQPRILFADEPTGNLDRHTGHQIEDLLFAMNAELGTTLVLVTHDPELAKRCQRCVRVEDGRLLEDGAPDARPSLKEVSS